jgi:hypothetical protein
MKRIPYHRGCVPLHRRPHADLPAPHVPDARDGKLDPYRGNSTVLIEVSTTELKAGDTIQLSVYATLEDTTNYWPSRRTLDDSDLGKPYPFQCPAALLQLDGGLFTAFYTVGANFSEFLDLAIHRAEETGLTRPWVEGTVGGIGTDLRMDNLDGKPVQIIAQDDRFVVRDRIALTWEPSGGDAYSPVEKLVPTDKGSVAFAVPYDIANKQGSVWVHYTLHRAGDDPKPSLIRDLQVVESAKPARLLRPLVLEADSEGQINPLAHEELTVHIPEGTPIEANQPLTLHWVGSTPEGSFDIDVPSAHPGMDIPVPVASLAFTAGQAIQVTYDVSLGGVTVTSDETILVIQPIPHNSPLLPRPTFSEADEVELDMANVGIEGAFVNIPAYRLAADGQRYWLTLSGVDIDDGPVDITIAENESIQDTSIDPIPLGVVSRANLQRFKDGSDIVLELKVTFDRSENEAKAVHFLRRTLIIKQIEAIRFPTPLLDEADDEGQIFPLTVKSLTARLPSDAVLEPGDHVFVHWTDPSGLGFWDGEIEDPMGDGTLEIPLWVLAYTLGETAALSYAVHREEHTWPSDPLPVHVQPIANGDPLLPTPTVTEADGDILDMNTLTGDVANITIAPYPLALEGQRYDLVVRGTLGNGNPVTIDIASNEPIGDPSLPLIPLKPAPREELERLRHDSLFTLSLGVAFHPWGNSNPSTEFPIRTYRIEQKPPTDYPAPILLEADAGRIDPLAIRSLTVRLPDGIEFREGDAVSVTWRATSDAGSRSIPVPSPQAGATVSLPITLLGYALGEEVTISYDVTRGTDHVTSELRPVFVERIPGNSSRLPFPTIKEAFGSFLDLKSFSGDAHVVIEPHYLFEDGQRYWLTVTAQRFGQPEVITQLENQPIRHEQEASIPLGIVDRSALERLDNRSVISVELRIAFNHSHDVEETIPLRPNGYSIENTVPD